MKTETNFLEKAVVNLTIEKAKLQIEVNKLTEDKNDFWRYYSDKKDLLEKAEKEIESLRTQIKNLVDQNQTLRRNLNGKVVLNEVNTEEETE